jgi:hypothetical protein
MLARLNEGYDCVCGWRRQRKDTASKRLFSFLANGARKMIIDDGMHDEGCSLRLYKSRCIKSITLVRDYHRYIPSLIHLKGFRLAEMRVNHNPRIHGKTKYGASRLFKGLTDLLLLRFAYGDEHQMGDSSPGQILTRLE